MNDSVRIFQEQGFIIKLPMKKWLLFFLFFLVPIILLIGCRKDAIGIISPGPAPNLISTSTPTDTYTITPSPSFTPSSTNTDTPTSTGIPSETPIQSFTLAPSITPWNGTGIAITSLTNTPSVTASETPIVTDCALVDVDYSYVGLYGGGFFGAIVRIRNNNPVPIHLHQADVGWDKLPSSRYLHAMRFNFSPWNVLDDFSPPTPWIPEISIELDAGGLGDFVAIFQPVGEPIQGTIDVELDFGDGCIKGISASMPTITPTMAPTVADTPTDTPTPDPCDDFVLSEIFNYAKPFGRFYVQINNYSGSNVWIDRFYLDWTGVEEYAASINHTEDVYIDWLKWQKDGYGAVYAWGGDADNILPMDYEPPTDTSFDSSSTWNGPYFLDGNGADYWLTLDLDGTWDEEGRLTDLEPGDFYFKMYIGTNGCVITN